MEALILCVLKAVLSLAIIALVLLAVGWALKNIAAAMKWEISERAMILLKVIGVLIVVIVFVQMLLTRSCGFLSFP